MGEKRDEATSEINRNDPAILWVMLDADPADQMELFRWYDEEHIPIRMRLPGWVRARRFLHTPSSIDTARDGEPARLHLAMYEVDTVGAFETPEYAAQYAEQTAWSAKVVPTQKRVLRSTFTQVADHRAPQATFPNEVGVVLVEMANIQSAKRSEVFQWYDEERIPERLTLPGCQRVRRYVRTDIPWEGAKWMQAGAAQNHLIVSEFNNAAAVCSPQYRSVLKKISSPAKNGPNNLTHGFRGCYRTVADQRQEAGNR